MIIFNYIGNSPFFSSCQINFRFLWNTHFIPELEKILNDSLGNAVDIIPYARIHQYVLPKENNLEINLNSNSNQYLLKRSYITADSRGSPAGGRFLGLFPLCFCLKGNFAVIF